MIQKYLEYPLLVDERKFDIRQWFMVTSWDPLELWIYQDGYVRFCGNTFSLDDYDTNIHLTNQAIQSPEKQFLDMMAPQVAKSSIIPRSKIWSYDDLAEWMDDQITPDEWNHRILPQIWHIIAETCARNATYAKQRIGCHEIYGADIGRELIEAYSFADN